MGALTMFESGGGSHADVCHTLRQGLAMMTEITSDFLDLSALSHGTLALHAVWTNTRELLKEWVPKLRCAAHSWARALASRSPYSAPRCLTRAMPPHRVALFSLLGPTAPVAIDDDVPQLLYVDPLRLRQVITHGVENAVT